MEPIDRRAKLTKDQVNQIRIKYDMLMDIKMTKLAQEFGVSRQQISNIVNFKSWK